MGEKENQNTPRVIFENGKFQMVEIVPLQQPIPEITEFTEEPEEIPDVLPLNAPAELTGTITLTEEQQATFKKASECVEKVWETVKALLDWLKEACKTIWARVCELYQNAKIAAQKHINDLLDAMLYAANDNQKWWHLYKHAKKSRTRKKYRHRLFRQLYSKMTLPEAEA